MLINSTCYIKYRIGRVFIAALFISFSISAQGKPPGGGDDKLVPAVLTMVSSYAATTIVTIRAIIYPFKKNSSQDHDEDDKAQQFILESKQQLAADFARGHGEYLSTLNYLLDGQNRNAVPTLFKERPCYLFLLPDNMSLTAEEQLHRWQELRGKNKLGLDVLIAIQRHSRNA